MFELKPNHRGDLEDHERELGCECEDYGDTEWTRESEAMHWSPEDKSRVAALARLIELARARAIPEED
jgi:hypothetical protein